jgi:hypothetical protein
LILYFLISFPSCPYPYLIIQMSLLSLKHSFLEAPSKIIEFYYDQVMPRLNKRNKVITISAAVVLICYKITDMLKPPKHLRHIPYQNYFGHFISILRRDSALERAQKFSFNLINSQDSNGLFLVRNLYFGTQYSYFPFFLLEKWRIWLETLSGQS